MVDYGTTDAPGGTWRNLPPPPVNTPGWLTGLLGGGRDLNQWLDSPSDAPATGIVKSFGRQFQLPYKDATGNWVYPNVIDRAVVHPVMDALSYFFTGPPKAKPADIPADPKPDPTATNAPPAKEPYLTLPGGGTKYPEPPALQGVPPEDFTAYRKALAAAEPEAPTEDRHDRLASILSGLAAGMSADSSQKGIGTLLMNMGAGGLEGLASEKATYRKSMQAYKDALQAYKEKVATGELGIAGDTQKTQAANIDLQNQHAEDLWKWHTQQQDLTKPHILSTKGGVVTYTFTDPKDGQQKIGTLGSTAPQDLGYYDTLAGSFRQDDTMGAALAGIDLHNKHGDLVGPAKSGAIMDDATWKKVQQQAQAETLAETQGSSMPPAEQTKRFWLHVYKHVYDMADQQGLTKQLMELGRTQGQQKTGKGYSNPDTPVTADDTTP